jgi:hypothetical protein
LDVSHPNLSLRAFYFEDFFMAPMSRYFLALPLLLVVISGCTSSRTPCSASGKVTYKGAPVTGGTIAFHRMGEEEKGSLGFSIKPDGTYEAVGLQPKEYAVTIETESINQNRPKQVYGGGKNQEGQDAYRKKMQEQGKAPGITAAQGTYVKIPPKYSDESKSGLTVKLKNGKNDLNFDLAD